MMSRVIDLWPPRILRKGEVLLACDVSSATAALLVVRVNRCCPTL